MCDLSSVCEASWAVTIACGSILCDQNCCKDKLSIVCHTERPWRGCDRCDSGLAAGDKEPRQELRCTVRAEGDRVVLSVPAVDRPCARKLHSELCQKDLQ